MLSGFKKFEQLDAYSKKEENLVSNMASLGATLGDRVTEVQTTWHDVILYVHVLSLKLQ